MVIIIIIIIIIQILCAAIVVRSLYLSLLFPVVKVAA